MRRTGIILYQKLDTFADVLTELAGNATESSREVLTAASEQFSAFTSGEVREVRVRSTKESLRAFCCSCCVGHGKPRCAGGGGRDG